MKPKNNRQIRRFRWVKTIFCHLYYNVTSRFWGQFSSDKFLNFCQIWKLFKIFTILINVGLMRATSVLKCLRIKIHASVSGFCFEIYWWEKFHVSILKKGRRCVKEELVKLLWKAIVKMFFADVGHHQLDTLLAPLD